MSNIDYLIIGIIVAATVALLIWLVRRNLKDEKDFEGDLNEPEHKKSNPEKQDL